MCDSKVRAAMCADASLQEVCTLVKSLSGFPLSPVEKVLCDRAARCLDGLDNCDFIGNVIIFLEAFHRRLTKFMFYTSATSGDGDLVTLLFRLYKYLVPRVVQDFYELQSLGVIGYHEFKGLVIPRPSRPPRL